MAAGEDVVEQAVERRGDERRRAAVPVPVDRRQQDRRAAKLERAATVTGVAVVADAWPLVRAGVRQLLEDRGLRVAADAATAEEAARGVGDRLDLAVVGPTLEAPLHAVQRLHRLSAADGGRPRVLLLVERVEAAELRGLLDAGVEGVVGRTIGTADLGAALDRVLAGHRVLAGGPLSVLARALAGLDVAGPDPAAPSAAAGAAAGGLTRKELEVLAHLSRHRSNAEIAAALHVSAATVKTHLQKIYGKLGVADRQGAVVAGVERGLLV
jgi:DNA-binding NarL/FixJ family response regulator